MCARLLHKHESRAEQITNKQTRRSVPVFLRHSFVQENRPRGSCELSAVVSVCVGGGETEGKRPATES